MAELESSVSVLTFVFLSASWALKEICNFCCVYLPSYKLVCLLLIEYHLVKLFFILFQTQVESEESENEKTPSYHIDERPSFDVVTVCEELCPGHQLTK